MIEDADEIYRHNTQAKTSDEWKRIVEQTNAMADRFASEVATIVRQGGEPEERMLEQQYEAAEFSIDLNLTEEENQRQTEIYKARFAQALEREVESGTEGAAAPSVPNAEQQRSGCLGALAVAALLPLGAIAALGAL